LFSPIRDHVILKSWAFRKVCFKYDC